MDRYGEVKHIYAPAKANQSEAKANWERTCQKGMLVDGKSVDVKSSPR